VATQARRADAEENTLDDAERAAALALESFDRAHKTDQPAEADAIEAARSALIQLPLGRCPTATGSRP